MTPTVASDDVTLSLRPAYISLMNETEYSCSYKP